MVWDGKDSDGRQMSSARPLDRLVDLAKAGVFSVHTCEDIIAVADELTGLRAIVLGAVTGCRKGGFPELAASLGRSAGGVSPTVRAELATEAG